MRLFRFRGGIFPREEKHLTADRPIEILPLPRRLYVPLQQHVGAPAEPQVAVGQRVLKGQLLAHSQGTVSAPVHAPTSGTVVSIGDFAAPHPSGLPVRTMTIEADGEDRWTELDVPANPFDLDPGEVAAHVGAAGIVGLGGATFPSAVKLSLGFKKRVHTLIINGGESEPYLTCDDRLMRERADGIVDGARIMLHALQADRVLVAIESNKPPALAAMAAASAMHGNVQAVQVPARYPMGSANQMIQTLTGMEVPAEGRSADLGVIVHNVGTAYAVHRAVRLGQPLIARVITVSGGAVRMPKNLEVPLGTLVSELFAYCGNFKEPPARLLIGGPMMGQIMPHTEIPVVKGITGLVALTAEEIAAQDARPCIRCGRCVAACPAGLMPLELAAYLRQGQLDKAARNGLGDCIACGSCTYVCPAHIPLVHYFIYGQGELAARERALHKTAQTRTLADVRLQRLQREAQAKAAKSKRNADRKAQASSLPPSL